VDLGYYDPTPGTYSAPLSSFSRINPDQKLVNTFPTANNKPRIYDTWSLHYENDGLQNTLAPPPPAIGGDTATNGLDDDNDGLVDERDLANPTLSEFDTHPPYATPLRGIKVTIRTYEPSSQQVREAVVIQNFDTK
jgi:hypothetical protein